MCLLAIHVFFSEDFVHIFCSFLIGFLSNYQVVSTHYIFQIQVFWGVKLLNIASQSVVYLFFTLMVTLEKQKFLILMQSSLSIFFSFMVCIFCVLSKKYLLSQSHEEFLLCFLLGALLFSFDIQVVIIFIMIMNNFYVQFELKLRFIFSK